MAFRRAFVIKITTGGVSDEIQVAIVSVELLVEPNDRKFVHRPENDISSNCELR